MNEVLYFGMLRDASHRYGGGFIRVLVCCESQLANPIEAMIGLQGVEVS
ncbi:hypothetical protein WKI41_08535 [Agrobacterium larrymoorei]